MIEIGTDGACKGNPGPGGWGVKVNDGTELYGGSLSTTNNRMEVTAFLKALEYVEKSGCTDVTIYSDSNYVIKGSKEWMYNWNSKNWKKVKNVDLWMLIWDMRHIINNCNIEWVKGHSGHTLNEEADRLANLGVPKE